MGGGRSVGGMDTLRALAHAHPVIAAAVAFVVGLPILNHVLTELIEGGTPAPIKVAPGPKVAMTQHERRLRFAAIFFAACIVAVIFLARH